MLTFPVTFWGGAAGSRTYITSPTPSFGSATTFTFTGVSLGSANGTSLVVVVVHVWDVSGDGRKLSSASIAGVGATIHVNVVGTHSPVQGANAAIISAQTASTSGTISVTTSNTCIGCGVDVYRLTGLTSVTPTATASQTAGGGAATSISTTISVPGNGILIQNITVFSTTTLTTLTGSGTTQDHEQTVPGDGDLGEWAGSAQNLPSGTVTISGSFTAGTASEAGVAWN